MKPSAYLKTTHNESILSSPLYPPSLDLRQVKVSAFSKRRECQDLNFPGYCTTGAQPGAGAEPWSGKPKGTWEASRRRDENWEAHNSEPQQWRPPSHYLFLLPTYPAMHVPPYPGWWQTQEWVEMRQVNCMTKGQVNEEGREVLQPPCHATRQLFLRDIPTLKI